MHAASIAPDQFMKLLHWQFFHSLMVTLGISLIKISVACFLLRLVPGKGYKWFLYGIMSMFIVSWRATRQKWVDADDIYLSSLLNRFHAFEWRSKSKQIAFFWESRKLIAPYRPSSSPAFRSVQVGTVQVSQTQNVSQRKSSRQLECLTPSLTS